ncbi:unnamed protein product [Medioppia subpectinata]|uniref:3'-5' exonuclease domain-containing protein n=1 Tax=Medioppia subpectinata TaxID=1979941 RepID=A0A7R9KS44_9ACAR|nr:unnamed protein product [Medioppia subpectinata]CAG2107595.1 unnamed protein product [Medioppia subpectinata]
MEDYDYVRNMTLMFFLDRLMAKDQPRTLHDLSCQFGTKGFTKEMRQIAGGSQSGLKKFLSQYPSLFSIDSDQVSITPLVKETNGTEGSGRRDYTREAVEFFREKLAQYGNAEVPLKSLLGHRSQAPPEVRHVSGQHSREFKDFLCKHSDVFVVTDEYVVLQSVITKLEADGKTKGSLTRMPEEVPFDPYLSQQFISMLEIEITQLIPQYSSKLTIDLLFNHLKNNCTEELWTNFSDNSQLKYKNMANNLANNHNNNNNNLWVGTEANIIRNTRIISKTKDGEEVVADILKHNTFVGIDCEGVNLGVGGQITLVQVSYMSASDPHSPVPKISIFDVLLNPDLLKTCLKALFESEKVIKVIHDVRNDSSCLHNQYGITITNIFDTQVSHSIIQQQNTGRPAYKAKYISLNHLCELYGGAGCPSNPKKEQMKKVYRKDQKYWSHRPLTEEMIFYAAFDVYALVPDVYNNMLKSIRAEYMPLLKQLNYEAVFAKIDAEKVKQLKKQRKLDMEVTDLKLKLFNTEAKQIVLSNREIRLLRYIDLTDEIRVKIEGSQKVAKKLERIDKKGLDSGTGSATVQSLDGNDSSSDEESDKNSDIDSDIEVEDSMKSAELNNYVFSPSDSLISNKSCCNCVCHQNGSNELSPIKTTANNNHVNRGPVCEASVQTLSTGDIVITKVFFEENPQ